MTAIGKSSAQFALRDPDIRMMLRVRADEEGAFEDLVNGFQQRLVGILRHIVNNREEAEDLAQEVFLRVFKSRKSYHPSARFGTWLFTIANNLALNHIRARKKKGAISLEACDSGIHQRISSDNRRNPTEQSPGKRLDHAELANVIRLAMSTLNERQRMAVALNKFEDMNYADIATIMGLTTKAVKSLLSRARASLREALKPYIQMHDSRNPAQESDEVKKEDS